MTGTTYNRCNNGRTQKTRTTCRQHNMSCGTRRHGQTWTTATAGGWSRGSRCTNYYRCNNGATQRYRRVCTCGRRANGATWRGRCPAGYTGQYSYRCNNGVTRRSGRCTRSSSNFCTGSATTFRGLTPTAAYNSTCAHQCLQYAGRRWCAVLVRASIRGVTGHNHAGWGWCYACGSVPRPPAGCPFRTNSVIQANWRNRGRWYNGRISRAQRARGGCTYDIRYDDGDREAGVAARLVRRGAPCRTRTYTVCDRVQVNWRGQGRWYAGRIQRVQGRSCQASYSILFDDGDTEINVRSSMIRHLGGTFRSYSNRQRVTANYRARGHWYPATVTR